MESETIKIGNLKGSENWAVWKFQLRIIFVSKGIYGIVQGSEKKPTAPTAADITKNENAQATFEKQVAVWIKNDGIAQKYIVTSIENTPMLHIINCSSAQKMWEKLHKVYENKSDTSIHMLQQEWFNCKKNSSDDIATHISKIQDLCCRLKASGETISDSMLITKIVMTLHEEYNHFISAWESTSQEQKTIDNLTARLVMEETRRKSRQSDESVALLTNKMQKVFPNNKKDKSEKNAKRRDMECYNCKKKGHIRKNCWFLEENKHKHPASFSQKRGAPSIEGDNALIVVGETSLSSTCSNLNNKSWLLDSGATSHMCSNRQLFKDYENLENATP